MICIKNDRKKLDLWIKNKTNQLNQLVNNQDVLNILDFTF